MLALGHTIITVGEEGGLIDKLEEGEEAEEEEEELASYHYKLVYKLEGVLEGVSAGGGVCAPRIKSARDDARRVDNHDKWLLRGGEPGTCLCKLTPAAVSRKRGERVRACTRVRSRSSVA